MEPTASFDRRLEKGGTDDGPPDQPPEEEDVPPDAPGNSDSHRRARIARPSGMRRKRKPVRPAPELHARFRSLGCQRQFRDLQPARLAPGLYGKSVRVVLRP